MKWAQGRCHEAAEEQAAHPVPQLFASEAQARRSQEVFGGAVPLEAQLNSFNFIQFRSVGFSLISVLSSLVLGSIGFWLWILIRRLHGLVLNAQESLGESGSQRLFS